MQIKNKIFNQIILLKPVATLFCRTIDDLAVLTEQRTLYIQHKIKTKTLSGPEQAWVSALQPKRQQMAVRLHQRPGDYFKEIYNCLRDPEFHRERCKQIQIAYDINLLIPWPNEWFDQYQFGSESLFKNEDDLIKEKLKKFEDEQKQQRLIAKNLPTVKLIKGVTRTKWLNKVEWALLTPLKRRKFRKNHLRIATYFKSLNKYKLKAQQLIKLSARTKNFKHQYKTKSILKHSRYSWSKSQNLKNKIKQFYRLYVQKLFYIKGFNISFYIKRFRLNLRQRVILYYSYKKHMLKPQAFFKFSHLFKFKNSFKNSSLTLIKNLNSTTNIVNKFIIIFKVKYLISYFNLLFVNSKITFINKFTVYNHDYLVPQSNQLLLSSLVIKYILKTPIHKFYQVSLPKNFWLHVRKKRKIVFRRRAKRFFMRKVISQGIDILRRRMYYHKNSEYYRLNVFKAFFKRQFARFRHISKNRLFIDLFRAHFKVLTGYNEKELMYLWFNFRRKYTKFWGVINLVIKFSQSILLTPPHLILFFGIVPTLATARAAVNIGALTLNGLISTISNTFAKPGDIIQITPNLWALVRKFYFYQQWSFVKLKLSRIIFFQIDWSMLMFTLVTWPKIYELVAPSYLSERWIRYYIRHFPVRSRKYHKVKMIWKTYPRPISKYKKNHR